MLVSEICTAYVRGVSKPFGNDYMCLSLSIFFLFIPVHKVPNLKMYRLDFQEFSSSCREREREKERERERERERE